MSHMKTQLSDVSGCIVLEKEVVVVLFNFYVTSHVLQCFRHHCRQPYSSCREEKCPRNLSQVHLLLVLFHDEYID